MMPEQSLNAMLQHVRKVAALHSHRALLDHELLERFVGTRDELAFTALVERHGPMVLSVCRRSLPNFHDAEDACQATFLVLARKAGSVRKKTSLSSWLHGVACRTAASLKRDQARRKVRDRRLSVPTSTDPAAEVSWREVQAVLDEELQQLPERYRVPMILCYLECMTRDEAAKQLGLTLTTLHGRLERARQMLRDCFTKRGLTLGQVMVATALAESTVRAGLTPSFVVSSTRAAKLIAAGQPRAKLAVGDHVLALTRRELTNMFLTKLKVGTTAVLCAGIFVAMNVASFTSLSSAKDPTPEIASYDSVFGTEPGEPAVKQSKTESRSGILNLVGLDLVHGTIKGDRVYTNSERTFVSYGQESWELLVKATTKFTVDGKDAKLADLQEIKSSPGSDSDKYVFVEAELEVATDPKQTTRKGLATRVSAAGIQQRGVVQAVNPAQSTLALRRISGGFGGDHISETTNELSIAKDVRVTINGRPAILGDLKLNMKVSLQMSATKELVLDIKAYGATVEGVLKAVDPVKNSVSVSVPSVQMTVDGVSVSKDAKVVLDGKDARLSDLKPGMPVSLRMCSEPDQSVIIAIIVGKPR